VDEVDSTQEIVWSWARQGRPAGMSLVADLQTAGRGRMARRWSARPGEAVQLSILLRPRLPPRRLALVSLALGVAVHEAVDLPGVWLKWPNDLLDVQGRKLAGVLAEAETVGGAVDFVVAGIGLNVGGVPDDLPGAACLADLGGVVDRERLAVRLVAAVLRRVEQVEQAPATLLQAWRSACGMWGQRVRVGEVEGVALGITDEGGLQLRADDGACRVVVAGDVHMVSVEWA
jgi:BirA family biotin operon repressor/biotin-[acetyl-CoA-carboxylase] ligase